MNLIHSLSFGQASYTLTGVVVDENNETLTGATVFLYPIEKGTISDDIGSFFIDNINKGSYEIKISFIGYNTLIDTIEVSKNTTYNAKLTIGSLSLQEVIVTDNYVENRKREETLNIEIVNDDYIKQNLGGSLMNSLERLPGVTSIDIGSGQSKPVIRGLGFNRVVVVENNIKHEAQQWGADHGLEIDQFAIDNIEVIKGPASLKYGSDAIGGVIDMKNRKIPDKNSLGGIIDLTGKTNNNFLGTSISLYGRKKALYAEGRITISDYADYKVPTDSIDIYSYRAALHENRMRNTAGNELNFHLTLGYIQNGFMSKIYMSNISSKSGFFANAHGLEPRYVDTELHDKSDRDIHNPYQTVDHFKIVNVSQYNWEKSKFELDLGFQRNFRQEWSDYTSHGYMPAVFPNNLDFNEELEREFKKNVYSGNMRFLYSISEATQLNVGINGEFQDNQIDGRGFIIPAYEQITLGAFVWLKHSFTDKSTFQLGARYDYGQMNVNEYYDWFQSPVVENEDTIWQYLNRAEDLNRDFSNISWSIGYNYHDDKWSYKINVGKSFRMPIAKELAANGVNYHRFSYEVGNPNLTPEISYQLDAGFEFHSKEIAIGGTPFVNYFTNYIYLNPSSEHDRLYGNGNQIFYYTESKVFRYGAELHAHYKLFKYLQLGILGEYVYSEQLSGEKEGYTLPFSPPASGILNIKYQKPKIKFIENAYFSLDYRITASQNDIVPPEEKTVGYWLINLATGGEFNLGKQKLSFSLQVQNLLNTKYFNHTSYYRLINVPEQGRNFILNISIPF